jgi:hypothetical protein
MEHAHECVGHIPQEATDGVVAGGNFLGECCLCPGDPSVAPTAELEGLTDANLNISRRFPRAGLR